MAHCKTSVSDDITTDANSIQDITLPSITGIITSKGWGGGGVTKEEGKKTTTGFLIIQTMGYSSFGGAASPSALCTEPHAYQYN